MRYREQSPEGDYVFVGTSPFLTDTPAAVAQAARTRLKLMAGEWFLDDREGFDLSQVVGTNTQNTRDLEVKRVIAGTEGVLEITSYFSQVDAARRFTVTCTVETIYGPITFTETL